MYLGKLQWEAIRVENGRASLSITDSSAWQASSSLVGTCTAGHLETRGHVSYVYSWNVTPAGTRKHPAPRVTRYVYRISYH
jgi:hypothetical protein